MVQVPLERQSSPAGSSLESRRLALKCLGELSSRQPSSSGSKAGVVDSSGSLGCVVAILAECTGGPARPLEDLQHSRLYASLLRTLNQLVVEVSGAP